MQPARILFISLALGWAALAAPGGAASSGGASSGAGAREAKEPAREKTPCWTIGRLKYGGGGDWYLGPSSLVNLSKRLRADLGLPVCAEERAVAPLDGDLYDYPILYMTG